MLALAVLGERTGHYTAEAAIDAVGIEPAGDVPDAAALAGLLAVGADGAVEQGGLKLPSELEPGEYVRRNLKVERSGRLPDRARYQVKFRSIGPEAAVAIVNKLCFGFVQSRQSAPTRAAESARHEAALAAKQAAGRVAAAERKYDEFIATSWEQVERAGEPATEPVAVAVVDVPEPEPPGETGSSDVTPAVPDPAVEQARHEVAELGRRMAELEKTRTELLVRMTPAHPTVKDVEHQLSELGRRRDAAQVRAARVSVSQNRPKPPPRRDEAVQRAAQQAAKQAARKKAAEEAEKRRRQEARKALLARRARLFDELRLARADFAAAAAKAAKPVEKPPSATCKWYVDQPAVKAKRVYGRTPGPIVAFAGAIALVAASSLLMISARDVPRVSSVGEAEEIIEAPVVGTVSEPAGDRPASPREGIVFRSVLLVCEVVLFVFIAAVAVVAANDADFAAQMAGEPLSVIPDSTGRLTELIWDHIG